MPTNVTPDFFSQKIDFVDEFSNEKQESADLQTRPDQAVAVY